VAVTRRARQYDDAPKSTIAPSLSLTDLNGIVPVSLVEHGLRRVIVVVGVMAAALMQTLDTTITNVALPSIQGNLGATQDEATWVITAYTIAAVIVIPIAPWVQGTFGRKRYFLVSIAGFTLASMACGMAESLEVLIFARFVQGAFGGGLLVTAQAILRDTFPRSMLSASQGIFTLAAIMGPALGPPLGGVLVDNYTWNWCFTINLVPGCISFLLMALFLRDHGRARAGAVDVLGLLLLATALGSLQYVLTEGEQHYWLEDPTIAFISVLCVSSAVLFVVHELHSDAPIVDLRVLANRTVGVATLTSLAFGLVIFGSAYTLPQFTQGPLGMTPTESGLLFLVRAIPVMLMTPFVIRGARSLDPRYLLAAGFTAFAASNYALAAVTTAQASFQSFYAPLILSGIGGSLVLLPLAVVTLKSASPKDGPKATAFLNLAMQLGGSIGVAWLDVVIHTREQFHSTVIAGNMVLSNPAVREFLQRHTVVELREAVNGQSGIFAYADASFVIAMISAAAIVLIALIGPGKVPLPEREAHVDVGG
jgi:DHA2 family multidrug resistance protein